MSLVFKTIQTEGIAELSYLVGDDDEGVAAVFDPRADCDVYIEASREAGVAITHIFETHIHADLVSGSRENKRPSGGFGRSRWRHARRSEESAWRVEICPQHSC